MRIKLVHFQRRLHKPTPRPFETSLAIFFFKVGGRREREREKEGRTRPFFEVSEREKKKKKKEE